MESFDESENGSADFGKKAAGAAIGLAVLLFIWVAKDRWQAAIRMSPSCVQIKDHRPDTDGGVTRIHGELQNTCSDEFGTVMVFFKLRDGQGRVVGQASATRRNLTPGESWSFETSGFFTPPDYEFERIMAY